MITTKVPYKPEDMSEIYENGAIVNLADINFPTCKTVEENMHALFVYLRNTGYKVEFDFTTMVYEEKVALLKEYLHTKIDYNIPILNTTWLSVLYACMGQKIEGMESILNDLELITMQSAEFEYVKQIWQFLISLPLYVIKRLDIPFESSAEKSDYEPNLVNFYYLLACDEMDDLILKGTNQIGLKPVDYEKVFTVDNTRLFEALSTFTFTVMVEELMKADIKEIKGMFQVDK